MKRQSKESQKLFKIDDIEEIAYLALQLRNAEIEYQKLPADKRPVVQARLKRATAELDGWLSSFITKKRSEPAAVPDNKGKENAPPNPDFGEPRFIAFLDGLARQVFSNTDLVSALSSGPIGIARYDHDNDVDYMIHFERANIIVTDDEIKDLVRSEIKKFQMDVTERVTLGKEVFLVTRSQLGTKIVKPNGEMLNV